MKKLHIDIETYSSVDIKSSGAYKYISSPDFEILLIAYAFDDEPVEIADIAQDGVIPKEVIEAFKDENVLLCAHNALFERLAFARFANLHPRIERWRCSAIKSAYCGLPLSLADVSKALDLKGDAKDAAGKQLIKYFCCPCKPTKVNGGRERNFFYHNTDKWRAFKDYCVQDVVAERAIDNKLSLISYPSNELKIYAVDQRVNDRGVRVDEAFALKAMELDISHRKKLIKKAVELTGLGNPNSVAQLKAWIENETGNEIESLNKDDLPDLIEGAGEGVVAEVLKLRVGLGKTSVKKYAAMVNCLCADGRAHGLVQFYGAGRTGRWAGRLVQVQNLPQNHLPDLDLARQLLAAGDFETFDLAFGTPDTLSQLIRTAFIPSEGFTFAVADFSAIEARVIAWLAGEKWRLKVFETHGKIYEASASMMFNIPIDSVKKGSDLRQKGKIAELALGYQGGVGALKHAAISFGTSRLSEAEMSNIVEAWRAANPAIKALWETVDQMAKQAFVRKTVVKKEGLAVSFDGSLSDFLSIKLPSGRSLYYYKPKIGENRFGGVSIEYRGMEQTKKIWGWLETYGGKLVENIVQAIARDLLAEVLVKAENVGLRPVMHVHDEIICEVPEDFAKEGLDKLVGLMAVTPTWAAGLPLRADGYVTPYYKKD